MVKLSLLFTVLLLVISSWSSPIPPAKCSPTISIGIENIFIGDILKNHKCKPTEQFMILYTEEKIFDEEVLHNDKAQSVCAGLSSLVLYGEKHQMFDKVCKDATFTETEDFCKVFLHNKMKELARQSLSSSLPDTYINALQSLDEASCDAACGGLKSEMCSMLVQLGQAFVSVSSDKGSSVLEEKSGNKDTVKDKEPITSSKTFVNKTGSSFHYIKARENGSRKISQSDSNVAPDQYTTGQRGPNNKGQGPKYLGQRQGPSYQQGGQKQSQYYPNQGRQGWNQNQGGPSYQQGGQRQPPSNPNQGRQGWNQNQGGPSYQQRGQKQFPYNSNQGRQGWNQNGEPSYQQRGQKQFPYNSNQGRQGWNQNQGAQRQPPSNPNQGRQGWNQNGGPSYQQKGQKQFPYNSNQGRQGWNENQGGPSYQQGGQRQPPSNPDQGRQGWKNPIQNQGGPKEPLSNPNQVGKDSKTSQENRQNSNQDKNPGFLDQTNNVPSGDVKTTNNSINGSNNKNNSIEPPTLSKTSSPLNTTNNTVGQTKPEKNKDANLGEAPEVTDGPKEPVNPFDLGLSDKGNAPHNMNDDHLWDDKPGPGKCDIVLISVDIIP